MPLGVALSLSLFHAILIRVRFNVSLFSGVDIPSLNLDKQWQFTPANFREGQIISGGDIFGTVRFL